MRIVLDHTRDEAENIRSFFFRPEKPVQYTAGQFGEWTLPHLHPDDRGIKRWFTISSPPGDDLISLTTKYAGKGSSSFKKALFKMEPGHEMNLSDPMGDFVLPQLIQTPLVFVAGGIGLTPFHSIVAWLNSVKETRPIKFIYGVRNEDEIIFLDTFEKAGIKPTIVVTEPSAAWGGERGRITAEMIMGLGQPSEDALVYVSGPEPMVEALEKELPKAGLNKRQFVGDFFPNYPSY